MFFNKLFYCIIALIERARFRKYIFNIFSEHLTIFKEIVQNTKIWGNYIFPQQWFDWLIKFYFLKSFHKIIKSNYSENIYKKCQMLVSSGMTVSPTLIQMKSSMDTACLWMRFFCDDVKQSSSKCSEQIHFNFNSLFNN